MVEVDVAKRLMGVSGVLNLSLKLAIPRGETLAVLGESGAGKTSLLRMIAGLLKPDEGKIIVEGETWFDSENGINLTPQQRKVGFVFQDFALFPNMTVRQNLTYARPDSDEIDNLLEMLDLGTFANQKTQTLSGGQKQRVAVARALVQDATLLLLDEPLSALDGNMRLKLQEFLAERFREKETTAVLVSHEPGEVLRLAEKVLDIQGGGIGRLVNTEEFFLKKKTSAKFSFVGDVVSVAKEDIIYIVTVLVGHDLVKVVVDQEEVKALSPGDKVLLGSKAFNPLIRKIL